MSRTRAALGLLCAAAALAGAPLPAAAQAPSDSPRITYRQRTLPNGLQLYTVLDRSTPTVAVQARYRFGTRDDPPGRNGLGHLLEHLMFQGSRNVAPSGIIYIAEDAGWPNFPGSQSNNDYDALTLYQTLASNSLERFLWAEADRLRGLAVTDSVLELEREAVANEIRGRLGEPYGRMDFVLARAAFTRHGYSFPEMGTLEGVQALTMAEVREAVARLFRPDNVVLLVVGDFEPAQLDRWVDQYFGSIPRPAAPLERAKVEEPARTAELRVTEYARVPSAAVAMAFQVPGWASPDMPAIRVARQVMAGTSGRLLRAMGARPELATYGSVGLTPLEEPSLMTLTVNGSRGISPDTLERLIRTEIVRMRDEPVAEADLERAKAVLIMETIRGMDSNMGKADALGAAAVLGHDPELANTAAQRIRAVTAADVQRVMRKYAADGGLVVLHFLPQAARPAQGTGAPGSNDQSALGAREGGK